ncbi:type II secretion system F family protein [Pandoraea sp.]|uniref:type II secretion system F family protein n=1 Tax=Pandoraea sp. TaxID=1883445 RepID=UPI0011F4153B|nr:type II secretion system F family protein [Pandoraea sp.]TAL54715.1 MAG: type II secretion system F family protein [Pandoraea sp.]TAM18517.1 MAG: type II secretion system F family protein [Pandoraea sp.]
MEHSLAHQLLALAMLLVAGGLLLAGGALAMRAYQQLRSSKVIDRMLAVRETRLAAAGQGEPTPPTVQAEPPPRAARRLEQLVVSVGQRWSTTRLGEYLIADEDRRLLEQCGAGSARGQALFLLSRVALTVLLPVLTWFWLHTDGANMLVRLVSAGAVGLILPKLVLHGRARRRREKVIDELPLLIDLLRLLQGVGLSMDQSLYVIVNDFHVILPILGAEFATANRQYATGRSREQSLARLRDVYDNDDLRALVRLIVQVERHGGAVQEPLQQFSDRLREQRRQTMKERIGKLTVKMTLAMMLTLLPALVLVIAGPAVLSLSHTLGSLR